jgi:mRNA interferase HigB
LTTTLKKEAMKVIGRNVLDEFGRTHADVVSRINAWVCFIENAQWEKPQDLKRMFPQASILPGNCVIFNLKGNHYRLQVKISYTTKAVLVKRIGTNAEYSKWIL